MRRRMGRNGIYVRYDTGIITEPPRRVALPFLAMYAQMSYNVRMKDKRIFIRVSEEFLEKLEYLMRINGFKNLSETIRKIIEKECRRETNENDVRC